MPTEDKEAVSPDGGATMVEYALVIALMQIFSTTAQPYTYAEVGSAGGSCAEQSLNLGVQPTVITSAANDAGQHRRAPPGLSG